MTSAVPSMTFSSRWLKVSTLMTLLPAFMATCVSLTESSSPGRTMPTKLTL